LFGLEVCLISASISISTKKPHLYQGGDNQRSVTDAWGGAVAPNCPSWIHHCVRPTTY